MTNIIGAELTALSLPGYGPYGPWIARPYSYGYGWPFIGAQAEPPQRTGLTAELAPIVAPATGGVTVEKRLDDKQVLHVKICVDGKCYQTSMDLAPAIAMVMQKLARFHDGVHAPKPPPATVIRTVETAVGMAEDAIVGALIARHVDTIAAGILGDIAGAVKGAVTGVASGVASTFRKLKGPIGAAAGIAAASAAAAIPGVGPVVAPMAGKLANDLVQAAAGDNKAKSAVAQAQQQARTDPNTALALETAAKAVANSTAAHHVKDTATKAAQGDPVAKQQIAQVATDAEQGDPAAKAVADLVANAMKSEWGAKLWERATGRGPGTISGQWLDIVGDGRWLDIVGADPQNPSMDPALKRDVYAFFQQPFVQPLISQSFWWQNQAWPFVAAFREWQFGKSQFGQDRNAYFRAELSRLQNEAQKLGLYRNPSLSNPPQASGWHDLIVGQWQDIVGAAIEDIRDVARTHASTKRGNAVGVIQYADGTLHGRGFGSLERAMEWLKHATRNRSVFIYAAACDKTPDGSARIHDEAIGEAKPRAVKPNAPVAMVG